MISSLKNWRLQSRWQWSLFVFACIALCGSSIAPYAPQRIDLHQIYAPPSSSHWLGTSENGVDILSNLLHGASLALWLSIVVVTLSLLVGASLALFSAFNRRVDILLSTVADIFQSFPGLLLNIAFIALAAKPTYVHVVVALTLSSWPIYFRLARVESLRVVSLDFISATKALGFSTPRIVSFHVLPNIARPLFIQASASAGSVILRESTLSFLGLSPSDSPSWGALLKQGVSVMLVHPHIALIAGSTIALTILIFNQVGDELS